MYNLVDKARELALSITDSKYEKIKEELEEKINTSVNSFALEIEDIQKAKDALFNKYFETEKLLNLKNSEKSEDVSKYLDKLDLLTEYAEKFKNVKELAKHESNIDSFVNISKKELINDDQINVAKAAEEAKKTIEKYDELLKEFREKIKNQYQSLLSAYKSASDYVKLLINKELKDIKNNYEQGLKEFKAQIDKINPDLYNDLDSLVNLENKINEYNQDTIKKAAELSKEYLSNEKERVKDWIFENINSYRNQVQLLKDDYARLNIYKEYDKNRFANFDRLDDDDFLRDINEKIAQEQWKLVLEDIKIAKENVALWNEKSQTINNRASELMNLYNKFKDRNNNDWYSKINSFESEARWLRNSLTKGIWDHILKAENSVKTSSVSLKVKMLEDRLRERINQALKKLEELNKNLSELRNDEYKLKDTLKDLSSNINTLKNTNQNNVETLLNNFKLANELERRFIDTIYDKLKKIYDPIYDSLLFKVKILEISKAGGIIRYLEILNQGRDSLDNFKSDLNIQKFVQAIKRGSGLNNEINNNIAPAWWDREYTEVDNSNWMASLKNSSSIHDLSIPGTHDAGMYGNVALSAYSKTQSMNWDQQLKLGIRWFDVRLNRQNWIYHGIVRSNTSLEDSLNEYIKFLEKNPTEFILMKIKDENESIGDDEGQWRRDLLDVLNKDKYRKYLYVNHKDSRDINVGDVRGKIVILNHMHHRIVGRLPYGINWKGDYTYPDTLQDYYEASVVDKKNYIVDHFKRASEQFNNHGQKTYVNYLNVAASFFRAIWHYSKEINEFTFRHLMENINYKKLGVVAMDFPGYGLVNYIIAVNKRNGL
ncbi:hypothetical protein [Mycoplasmopsis alligatoris]|uniref:1-phosphatidylinositol phosphodiesterase n=1 Tax=Mycoplasmopsis alligatoris A21JP2 TaxID=747682 RepID=D4XUY3_9BACT|nr:hypothetical protein [Mycoplasmopsis alligatoris]EFF41832.1 phosphatidylinositol-specific phospholipase C, X domain protein [Mycoplasmopsis alligatoris A21JP2]